jgi:hypothetical protein
VGSFKNLLENYAARKAEFYMKAFLHRTKGSWLKSWPSRLGLGKWKWNAYLILEKYCYMGQGFSGERCGPWASFKIFDLVTFTLKFYQIFKKFSIGHISWMVSIGFTCIPCDKTFSMDTLIFLPRDFDLWSFTYL